MSGDSRHAPARPERGDDRDSGRRSGGRHTASRAGASTDGGGTLGAAPDHDSVARLVEPVITAAGMDLESVRVTAAGRRRLLRVVVDADGGVSLDEAALVSRALSAELDASGVMGEGPYTLEVSSPGAERPLTEPRHWRRAVGRLVRAVGVEGRVIAAAADGVTLEVGGERRKFGYGELGDGKVQLEFSHGETGGDGGWRTEPDGH